MGMAGVVEFLQSLREGGKGAESGTFQTPWCSLSSAEFSFQKRIPVCGPWREFLPGTSKKPKTFLPLTPKDPLGRLESQETDSLYMKLNTFSLLLGSFQGSRDPGHTRGPLDSNLT